MLRLLYACDVVVILSRVLVQYLFRIHVVYSQIEDDVSDRNCVETGTEIQKHMFHLLEST